MPTTQTETIPGNPLLGQNPDAVVGSGLLRQRKYGIPEASRAMGMGETSLRAIIAAGGIPVLRLARKKVVLLESDMEAYLQGNYGALSRNTARASRTPSLPDAVSKSKYLN
jgi:hypothetical protein